MIDFEGTSQWTFCVYIYVCNWSWRIG